MIYKITVEYYYYHGAYDYPLCGTLTDLNEEPYTFKKEGDAIAFLKSQGITFKLEPRVYCVEGPYMLNHGEYGRPTYTIITVEEE